MASGAEFYCYPWDLADEGVDAAAQAIAAATGPGGGVLLALSYHVGTYFSPHNPVRKVYFGEEGAAYFQPDESLYSDTHVRPLVSDLVTGPSYLPDLVQGLARQDLRFSAWAVYFYNHHLPQAFPDIARRDCFGQPCLAQVCPAAPAARAYALALTRDMLRHGPAAVQMESLGYLPFRYGFRNPKVLVDIAPWHEFLLGLCFCPHCIERADQAGVQTTTLREGVARLLTQELPDHTKADAVATLAELIPTAFGGDLAAYLEVRVSTASSLFEEVAATVRAAGAAVSFFGSLDRHQTGLDRDRVLRAIDAIYLRLPGTPEQAADKVTELRAAMPADTRLVSIAAPGADAVETHQRIAAETAAGVDGFAFYTYGLLRQAQIDWLAATRDHWATP